MQNKKSHKQEVYCHPLLRDPTEVIKEDHLSIIPTYQQFQPSHSSKTSAQLMRWSTVTPHSHSEVSLSLTPFHHSNQQLPLVQSLVACQKCGATICPQTQIHNYTLMKCAICSHTQQINTTSYEQNTQSHAYQIVQQLPSQRQKRVLIVIEASQHLYQHSMQTSVINCIQALKDSNTKIGLLFFDQHHLMVLDPLTPSLTKITLNSHNHRHQQWDGFPLSLEEMFVQPMHFGAQHFEIINSVMYQAFFNNKTILSQVLVFLNSYLPLSVHIKVIATTLNCPQTIKPHQQSTFKDIVNSSFKDIVNSAAQNIVKSSVNYLPAALKEQIQVQAEGSEQGSESVGANMQFLMVPRNVKYQQCVDALGYTLYRVYSHKHNSHLNQKLYYDLFMAISEDIVLNTQIEIICTSNVTLLTSNHPAHTLYGNLQMKQIKTSVHYNHYKITVKQAKSNTMVPLTFKFHNLTQKLPYVQVRCTLKEHKSTRTLLLNSGQFKVMEQGSIGVESIDDQVLFNATVRRAVGEWKDRSSFKQLTNRILDLSLQWLTVIKSNCSAKSITVPKSLKHYFLYIYMLDQLLTSSTLNLYDIYVMMTANLQCFGKKLYPRVYTLQKGVLKNIKPATNLMDNNQLVFIDNGTDLFMLFHEPAVQKIKTIFGQFDTVASLANKHYELPELESNEEYRAAVDVVRGKHDSNYLPLRLVDKYSSVYDCELFAHLYDKSKHISYLKCSWKQA